MGLAALRISTPVYSTPSNVSRKSGAIIPVNACGGAGGATLIPLRFKAGTHSLTMSRV